MILANVGLEVLAGRTIAVVGETGAGKTTLARTLVGLIPPDEGEIWLEDERLAASVNARPHRHVAALQMVFQSSTSSLNPRHDVQSVLSRAARRLGKVKKSEVKDRVSELLQEVQLPAEFNERRPDQLSGGEKQRVAIARALAAQPRFLILDEAVSALDVSVQASILALLRRIQETLGTAFLFISHDLAAVAAFADDVIVLYGGRIVERGPVKQVIEGPHHPYTEVLFRSVPGEIKLNKEALQALEGAVPRNSDGCIFASRCPWRIGPICDSVQPPTRSLDASHEFLCHYTASELSALIASDRERALSTKVDVALSTTPAVPTQR